MEFMNRGTQSTSAPRPAGGGASAAAPSNGGGKVKGWKGSKGLRVLWMVLLFGVTILAVAILTLLYVGNSKETDYVDSDKHQAVFLTNGQVYFGKIKNINRQYVDLQGIYYLNVNQQVQPNQKDANTSTNNNVTLVKLGCELHGPIDQMLINREQITFWENLKTNGEVAKAIAKWAEQNPNGQQECATADTSTSETDAKP